MAAAPDQADPSVAELVVGVRAGDRALLGRAITLVESTRPEHRAMAQELLAELAGPAGPAGSAGPGAHRVGVTGVPGVGKSTFIESLGTLLVERGRRVAVLAVDPSSARTGGSILGDKTRMAALANHPAAFVRPSPASGELGGVGRMTRETITLCEAAGYDVVLVETVGVGQSETTVAEMVDFFLVLMLPGAGDDLQGVKKGILELADLIAVNKADGPDVERAGVAAADYRLALHLTAPASPTWTPPVVTCSGLTGDGLDGLWEEAERHRRLLGDSGELAERRAGQRVRAMRALLGDRLTEMLHACDAVAGILPGLEDDVRAGRTAPAVAVARLLEAFRSAA